MKRSIVLTAATCAIMLAQSASAAFTNILINPTTHNGSFETGIVLDDGQTDRGMAVDEWGLGFVGSWSRFVIKGYVPEASSDGDWGVCVNNGVTATISLGTVYQAMNSNDVLTLSMDMLSRAANDPASTYEATVTLDGKTTLSFGVQSKTSGTLDPELYSGQVTLPQDCMFYSVKLVIVNDAGINSQDCMDNVVLTRTGDEDLDPEMSFTILMGADTCNGDFQEDDNLPWYAWTDSARTNSVADADPARILTNTTGRLSLKSSNIGWVQDFGGSNDWTWTARRTYYKGGNDAWGMDGATVGDIAGYPNIAYYMNSGDSTLQSTDCPTTLYSGDSMMVQFDLMPSGVPFSTNGPSDHVFANCAGMVLFNDGAITNSWTAEESYATNAGQTTTFTKIFPVTSDVTNMNVVLYFSSGRGFDDRFTGGSNNKTLLDNVRVLGLSAPSGAPIEIVSFGQVASGIYEMVVDVQGGATRQIAYPISRDDMTGSGWAQVPHSSDGISPYINSNMMYSTESGTNRVIYIQSADAQEFFGISTD